MRCPRRREGEDRLDCPPHCITRVFISTPGLSYAAIAQKIGTSEQHVSDSKHLEKPIRHDHSVNVPYHAQSALARQRPPSPNSTSSPRLLGSPPLYVPHLLVIISRRLRMLCPGPSHGRTRHCLIISSMGTCTCVEFHQANVVSYCESMIGCLSRT